MKFTNHKDLSEHIFETYLEFGKYYLQDKSVYDAFDLGVETFEDFKVVVIMLVEAMDNPHEHLDDHDYEFVGYCIKYYMQQKICSLYESDEKAFDEWLNEIQTICGEKQELFCDLTEI